MRLLYKRFSGDVGFTSGNLRDAIAEVAGASQQSELRMWLQRVLETTAELDYEDAIDWFGLRMTAPPAAPRPWLGIVTRVQNDKTVVSEVRRGSPAASAGISLLDEIVAINGDPVAPDRFAERLGRFAPGAKITLSISRADAARPIDVVLATDPGHGWELSGLPTPTRDQSEHLDAWLQ